MAVAIHLDVTPPQQEGIVRLDIWEAGDPDGPWVRIDSIEDVGGFPDYITEVSTPNAFALTDWFAVEWIDDQGVTTELSNAVQGGTVTLLGEIVQRVLLRDSDLDENVVSQEAEVVIEQILGLDPITQLWYRGLFSLLKMRGVVKLTLANSQLALMSSLGGGDYVAGLVSEKGTGTSKLDEIKRLLASAASDLGVNYSVVARIAKFPIAGGASTVRGWSC